MQAKVAAPLQVSHLQRTVSWLPGGRGALQRHSALVNSLRANKIQQQQQQQQAGRMQVLSSNSNHICCIHNLAGHAASR